MTALPVPQHPVLGCVTEIGAALDAVGDAQPVYLSTAEKATALRELAALEGRVVELRLRVMAAAGDVAEEAGARDVAAWFAHETRTEPEVARADLRLARALDADRPRVAAGLASGPVFGGAGAGDRAVPGGAARAGRGRDRGAG